MAAVRVVLRRSQRQRERRRTPFRSPARRTAKRAPDDDPHRVRRGVRAAGASREQAGTEPGLDLGRGAANRHRQDRRCPHGGSGRRRPLLRLRQGRHVRCPEDPRPRKAHRRAPASNRASARRRPHRGRVPPSSSRLLEHKRQAGHGVAPLTMNRNSIDPIAYVNARLAGRRLAPSTRKVAGVVAEHLILRAGPSA
jgi:hypothetical protein